MQDLRKTKHTIQLVSVGLIFNILESLKKLHHEHEKKPRIQSSKNYAKYILSVDLEFNIYSVNN